MNSPKKRVYKQIYRPAWEELSEFQGWLTESTDGANRAYCRYCQKTLHAHRLSLLKHTSTLKHQTASDAIENENKERLVEPKTQTKVIKWKEQNKDTIFNTKIQDKTNAEPIVTNDVKLAIVSKEKKINLPSFKYQSSAIKKSKIKNFIEFREENNQTESQVESINDYDNSIKKIQTLRECYEKNVFEDEEMASFSDTKHTTYNKSVEEHGDDDEEEMGEVEVLDQSFQNQEYFQVCTVNDDHGYQKIQENIVDDLEIDNSAMASDKPPITTHVLNTSTGKPGENVKITLYKLKESGWTKLTTGVTNSDGRLVALSDRSNFSVGQYKLHFDVDTYFKKSETKSLYPYIEIAFECDSVNEHFHIPLLLNPFGYSTYRGS